MAEITRAEMFALQDLADHSGEFTGRPAEMAKFEKKGIAAQCLSKAQPGKRAWQITDKGRAILATTWRP